MNPEDKSEISPTEKPSAQGHTPSEVFNLVLAAQNGSVEACIEVSRCFEEGDGVPESQIAAYAWLMAAASNGSEAVGAELVQMRSRLSPDEIKEAEALAQEYSDSSRTADYSDWVAEFNLMIAGKLSRQTGQKLTAAELLKLLNRADADDEEALRTVNPMLDALREQMTAEEMAMLEQQIIDGLSAVRENPASSKLTFKQDRNFR